MHAVWWTMFAVLAISHPECYCILMRNENAAREWKSNNLLRRKLSIQTKAVVVEASELEKKKKKQKNAILCVEAGSQTLDNLANT